MIVLSAEVKNFASYKHLKFDFNDKGLCLIDGANGSGKSTLCDIIPWILFGKTSKKGSVDEIVSWNAEGPTEGTIKIQLNTGIYEICRQRSPNDLYWKDDIHIFRGKDLADSQKHINNLLGMDLETYLAGSYFHEFSKTASFFTLDSKDRKSICDLLVDQTLSKKVQTSLSEEAKSVKDELKLLTNDVKSKKQHISDLERQVTNTQHRYNKYEQQKAHDLEQLSYKDKNFESYKESEIKRLLKLQQDWQTARKTKLNDIHHAIVNNVSSRSLLERNLDEVKKTLIKHCSNCGALTNQDGLKESLRLENALTNLELAKLRNSKEQLEITKSINPYDDQLVREQSSVNTYEKQIAVLKRTKNPHLPSVEDSVNNLSRATIDLSTISYDIEQLTIKSLDLEVAQTAVLAFRSNTVKSAIDQLQDGTNHKLSEYFDAELRVMFDVSDSEKFEVEIYKDGNLCSYSQLSKGQRQMLKLCFATSVMTAVSNHKGISFNILFFDESLDGMSPQTKKKAIRLFEFLATQYPSVFVVEHSDEIKTSFSSKLSVSLSDSGSQIEET